MDLSYILFLSHGPHSLPSTEGNNVRKTQLTINRSMVMYLIDMLFLNIEDLHFELVWDLEIRPPLVLFKDGITINLSDEN